MFDFNKPNIEITDISDDKKYGRFVVEPLERGYGTTLGNSLRRIMLSSLPGSAISQVKIDGVLHEFSSIPGVKEDVTEIIMNLKSLAIKNTSESDEPKTAYIEFEGEGVVTAADIQVDQDIEIMNPETVIATLNGGADSKLYMELTITNGRGYVSADKNKNDELPIAVIPIDSIYTPVERVNLTVENTRVGQITDFDKLTLDVYTNGTLLPDEAVSLAAKVLSEHLKLFIDLSEATKKAYDDRYFLWHSKQGIYAQEKACEDYQSMLIYGNVREYYTVDRELSVDYFKNFLKRGTSYKELQNEIGEPNGELINDEFVYEITQGVNEKTYITCEVLGDEIIKLEVCNEEKVIETIYEKNSEEN